MNCKDFCSVLFLVSYVFLWCFCGCVLGVEVVFSHSQRRGSLPLGKDVPSATIRITPMPTTNSKPAPWCFGRVRWQARGGEGEGQEDDSWPSQRGPHQNYPRFNKALLRENGG